MDINMPEMNREEATKNIRTVKEYEKFSEVPIIALTANAIKGDREHFLSIGMDDCLSKPIDNELLYAMIENHLKNS